MGLSRMEVPRDGDEKVQKSSHGDHGAADEEERQKSEPLKCPRCDSTNTKFCYYNNYNKSQPRHFCKACKRHWTSGGTLRNVPVGGGRKKRKRLKASDAAAGTTTTTTVANDESNNLLGQLGETLRNAMNKNGENQNIVASSVPSPFHYQDLQTLHAGFGLLEANQCSMIPSSVRPPSLFSYLVGEANSLEHLDHTSMGSVSWNDNPWSWINWDMMNVVDVPSKWDWTDISEVSASELIIPWDDTRLIP